MKRCIAILATLMCLVIAVQAARNQSYGIDVASTDVGFLTSPTVKTNGNAEVTLITKSIIHLYPCYPFSELGQYPWLYKWTEDFEKELVPVLTRLKAPGRNINYQAVKRLVATNRFDYWYTREKFGEPFRGGILRDVIIGESDMICDAMIRCYDDKISKNYVLCDYINITPEFQKRYPNITGVVLVPRVLDTIRLGLTLFPKTQEIAVITDDIATDPEIHQQVLELAKDFKKCKIISLNAGEITTQEMLSKLRAMPKNSFFIYCHWRNFNRDDFPTLGAILTAMDAVGKPHFTLSAVPFPSGTLGGYIHLPKDCANKVGKLVGKIFDSPDNTVIPAIRDEGHLVIDMEVMRKFGLSGKNLPKDTVLLNQKYPVWVVYRTETIIASIAFSVIFILLCLLTGFYIYHKHQTRKSLALFNALPVRILACDILMGNYCFTR